MSVLINDNLSRMMETASRANAVREARKVRKQARATKVRYYADEYYWWPWDDDPEHPIRPKDHRKPKNYTGRHRKGTS